MRSTCTWCRLRPCHCLAVGRAKRSHKWKRSQTAGDERARESVVLRYIIPLAMASVPSASYDASLRVVSLCSGIVLPAAGDRSKEHREPATQDAPCLDIGSRGFPHTTQQRTCNDRTQALHNTTVYNKTTQSLAGVLPACHQATRPVRSRYRTHLDRTPSSPRKPNTRHLACYERCHQILQIPDGLAHRRPPNNREGGLVTL